MFIWLLVGTGSAIPVPDSETKELDTTHKKNIIYRMNCSTRANAFFCQHHGAYCSGYHLHGSAFCHNDCQCIPDAGCSNPRCGLEDLDVQPESAPASSALSESEPTPKPTTA